MIGRKAWQREGPTETRTAAVIADIAIPADTPIELLTAENGDIRGSRRTEGEDERLVCLRFPHGESLQTTYEDWTDRGVPVDIRRIRHEQEDGPRRMTRTSQHDDTPSDHTLETRADFAAELAELVALARDAGVDPKGGVRGRLTKRSRRLYGRDQ